MDHLDLPELSEPVSYTHLDVYKRQVQYYHDHKNLGLQGCATNLGISQQTLSRWQKELRETGDIESRGSGNYRCV